MRRLAKMDLPCNRGFALAQRSAMRWTFMSRSNGLDRCPSLARYYADKRKSYPPDIERQPGREYVFRV